MRARFSPIRQAIVAFSPVELTNIDWTYSQNVNPNQLWAQAFALYRNGESWKLTDEERKAHGVITEHYEPEDPYENWLRDYIRH